MHGVIAAMIVHVIFYGYIKQEFLQERVPARLHLLGNMGLPAAGAPTSRRLASRQFAFVLIFCVPYGLTIGGERRN